MQLYNYVTRKRKSRAEATTEGAHKSASSTVGASCLYSLPLARYSNTRETDGENIHSVGVHERGSWRSGPIQLGKLRPVRTDGWRNRVLPLAAERGRAAGPRAGQRAQRAQEV